MQQLIGEFNRENLKPLIFVGIVLLLLAVTAYPQRRFGGRVVEIVDGKTAVIEVPTGGRVTVVLQFIETPEREQPLYQMVKDHLATLVLGKTVEFLPRRILERGSVGQIFLGGVDISRQMLRDGAAWYALPEKSAQEPRDSELYMATEAQAKVEKLGVWGAENIKPAWEFRAEKQIAAAEMEKAQTQAAMMPKPFEKPAEKPFVVPKPKLAASPQMPLDMWSAVDNVTEMDRKSDNGGLVRDSLPGVGSLLMTSGDFYEFKGADATVKFESRTMLVTTEGRAVNGSGFAIGFLTYAENMKFGDADNLTITADGRKFVFGKAVRLPRTGFTREFILLMYKTDEKVLEKIADAKNVVVNIGKYSGKLDDGYQMRIKNLLAMTTN
jgi:endonuclease YncB( thermonuclease family)